METANGRSVGKKQSFNQTEPAGPDYININEARENVSTISLLSLIFNYDVYMHCRYDWALSQLHVYTCFMTFGPLMY